MTCVLLCRLLFLLVAACAGVRQAAADGAAGAPAAGAAAGNGNGVDSGLDAGFTGQRLLDTLRSFRLQFAPVGEADVTTALPTELGGSGGRDWSSAAPQVQAASGGPDAWTGASKECSELRGRVVGLMSTALKLSSTWVVQQGLMDWGFLGSENETDACGGTNCAYTNPASPYGLTVLPPAPTSRSGTGGVGSAMAAQGTNLPEFVRQDVKQRASTSPPTSGAQSVLAALSAASNPAASPTSRQSPLAPGSSAAYQLLPKEVVVVAGCVPPVTASRYFGATGYLHSAWDDERNSWISVFSALGDTRGGYVQPAPNGTLPSHGTRNRLATSLPSVQAAAGLALSQQQSSNAPAPATGSGGGLLGALLGGVGLRGVGRGGLLGGLSGVLGGNRHLSQALQQAQVSKGPWTGLSASLGALPQELVQVADGSPSVAAGTASGAIAGAGKGAAAQVGESDDPFGQFTVLVMSASKEAAAKVEAALRPALLLSGLLGPDALSPSTSTDSDASKGSSATPLNALPIPTPFNAGMGIGGTSPWFMLILRNIVPAGKLNEFRDYISRCPWTVWRLTPLDTLPPAPTSPVLPLPLLTQRMRAPPPPAPAFILTPPQDPADTWPTPQVVPRLPPPSAGGVNQSEVWMAPAFEALNAAVGARLSGLGYTLAWNLGSDSPFAMVDLDWGLDCYKRKIDFCNGDNRDAQYISSLPFVQLDSLPKVLYIVGVNHVATGLAAYTNIAPSDPVQRLGLESWDDTEVRGTAAKYLAGGPFAALSPYLYVVAFSRNCSGVPHCKEIPLAGPRSVPLLRALLLIERAYVNPATGVGPSAARLLNFRAVVATPGSEARPRDTKAYRSMSTLVNGTCRNLVLNTTLACAPPASSLPSPSSSTSLAESLAAMASARGDVNRGGAGTGGAGVTQSATQPLLSRLASALPSQTSACCVASKAWADSRCWCSEGGRQLLDDIAPVAGRGIVVGVGRLCGQRTGPTSCL